MERSQSINAETEWFKAESSSIWRGSSSSFLSFVFARDEVRKDRS